MIESVSTADLLQSLLVALTFTGLALITNWISYLKQFFSLPYFDIDGPNLRFRNVIWTFVIFLIVFFFLAPFTFQFFLQKVQMRSQQTLFLMILQILTFFFTGLFLFIYNLTQNHQIMLRIWKDWQFPGARSFGYDIGLGILTWIIAIPAVFAIASYFEIFSTLIFGETDYEQLAVKYLRKALQNPYTMIAALFSILLAAPILEEYLFRGIMMTWLRKKLGALRAICLSAFFFAIFHYAPIQSSLNFALIASLFVLGLYQGFIYEKTRSLLAPIFLHVTFNFISVIRIIFIGE